MSQSDFHRRHRVFLKTDGRCFYCGTDLTDTSWHIDHSIPKISGGTGEKGNLVPACRDCNVSKGGNDSKRFKELLIERVINRIAEAQKLTSKLKKFGAPDQEVQTALLNMDASMSIVADFDITFYGENESGK